MDTKWTRNQWARIEAVYEMKMRFSLFPPCLHHVQEILVPAKCPRVSFNSSETRRNQVHLNIIHIGFLQTSRQQICCQKQARRQTSRLFQREQTLPCGSSWEALYWHFPCRVSCTSTSMASFASQIPQLDMRFPRGCYYYSHGRPKAEVLLHLGAVLPASIIVKLQFLPVIGYKALLLHRITGYMILLLSIASIIGVFIIVHDAFGGSLSFQNASGTCSFIFTVG